MYFEIFPVELRARERPQVRFASSHSQFSGRVVAVYALFVAMVAGYLGPKVRICLQHNSWSLGS